MPTPRSSRPGPSGRPTPPPRRKGPAAATTQGGRSAPPEPTGPASRSAEPGSIGERPALGHRATGSEATDPLSEAVAQIGDRWSLLVVDALLDGPRRFGELLDEIDGLAPNILSRRLKQLDADGLVVAEPYSRRPLRHTYRLTAPGEELAGVLRLLAQWAAARRGASPGGAAAVGLAHQTCGTALEAQWYCPTCAQVVDSTHATDLHWL